MKKMPEVKRVWYRAICVAVIILLSASCAEEDGLPDESLLIGIWRTGTLYYEYNANHSGSTWDTGEDVTKDEAQGFTWTLNGSTLTQLHIIVQETRATVPKVYTVTELTGTSLIYRDDFGKSYSFTIAE
jgi:hypothetical protein